MTSTTIAQLKARYRDGSISKQDFIREALDVHRALFQYMDVIQTTDIREIRIGADSVVVSGEGVHRLSAVTDETIETNYVFLHHEAHAEKIARLVSAA
ncbi:hypothetical protein [Paraburkholderia bannensis]|uniref:hypothetical protein n=1 Tax=Paraburkholderia bannensis TaxID=765414 RepID=UPI002AB1CCD0|nr:hypothetical protein [Paraburkholderia bannensis]